MESSNQCHFKSQPLAVGDLRTAKLNGSEHMDASLTIHRVIKSFENEQSSNQAQLFHQFKLLILVIRDAIL